MGLFDAVGSIVGSMFNYGSTMATNNVNYDIAKENRDLQNDWNQIQFDYNRDLQDRLFEREDTAYQRTAADMAAAGINPLMMSGTNGAGQAIPSSEAAHAPKMDFQAIAPQVQFGQLGGIATMMNEFDNLKTNKTQRDLLQSQQYINDAAAQSQTIDNLIKASKNNIGFDEAGQPYLIQDFKYKDQDFNKVQYENEESTKNRNKRVDEFQLRNGVIDGTPDKVLSPIIVADNIRTAMQKESDEKGNEPDNFVDSAKTSVSGIVEKNTNAVKRSLSAGAEAIANQFKGATKQVTDATKKATKKAKDKSKNIYNNAKQKAAAAKAWLEDHL